MTSRQSDASCQVCGHGEFEHVPVIWPELARQWELAPDELAYLDVQQGTRCSGCGANVRSQALARALLKVTGLRGTFESFVSASAVGRLRVLEVNEAGTLTPLLSKLPGHRLARFPDVDLQRLPFADGDFELVVHSDTLEHVADPALALTECHRVLAPDGACVFTVPIVIGRLTRSRAGLEPSYHGDPTTTAADFLVHTEFGCDIAMMVLEAGFSSCELVPYRFPSGLAIVARHG